jgi:hypothetical protein
VKNLVSRCATSDDVVDIYFATSTAGSLVHHDYEFTRDTLLSIFVDPDRTASGEASERAMFQIEALMRGELNPEQVEDFNAQIVRYGYDPL